MLQIVSIGLAYAAFCYRPVEQWREDPKAYRQFFSLSHGVTMIFVIPQHVPTLLASLGLFFFSIHLHSMDIKRIVDVADDISEPLVDGEFVDSDQMVDGEIVNGVQVVDRHSIHCNIVHVVCLIADNAQQRLDHTCQSMTWLWLHQLVYGFTQIVVVASHLRREELAQNRRPCSTLSWTCSTA